MTWAERFSVAVAGFFVGCLTGLSISPTVGVVVSALVATITSLVSALAGTSAAASEQTDHGFVAFTKRLRPAALSWLAGGVLLGAIAGLWAREHQLFSPAAPDQRAWVREEVQFWTELGLDGPEVARALFEQRTGRAPKPDATKADASKVDASKTDGAKGEPQRVATAGLFNAAVQSTRCGELRSQADNDEELRNVFRRGGVGEVVDRVNGDAAALRKFVAFACPLAAKP